MSDYDWSWNSTGFPTWQPSYPDYTIDTNYKPNYVNPNQKFQVFTVILLFSVKFILLFAICARLQKKRYKIETAGICYN